MTADLRPTAPDLAAILAEVRRIARDVAAVHVDEVDRDSRFPHETVDALRAAGLLSLPAPVELGGAGLDAAAVSRVLGILAGADGSLGVILGMHFSQVDLLARYGTTAPLRAFLREVVERQLLVANVNSEIAVRGSERASFCFVDVEGQPEGRFRLVKDSPVISYGQHADAYVVTARRAADSAPGDQVLAVVRGEDAELTPKGVWDALGYRGTCSLPFHLEATGDLAMVLPVAYDKIVNESGLGVNNVMFAGSWLGMAEAAVAVAHRWARKKGMGTPEAMSTAPLRTAELAARLDAMRGLVHLAGARWLEVDGTDDVGSLGFVQQMQTLKVAGSGLLAEIVAGAVQVVGLGAYRNGSEWSLGRQLRDAYGAGLMVNNEAVLMQNAQLLLVRKTV